MRLLQMRLSRCSAEPLVGFSSSQPQRLASLRELETIAAAAGEVVSGAKLHTIGVQSAKSERRLWSACLRSAWPLGATESRRSFVSDLGDVSRKHQEQRLMGYSQQQMYDVVADVEHYKDFVPWCVISHVIKKSPTYLEAELEVGFQLFIERYISKVTLAPPHSVQTVTQESTLFHHLHSTWDIKPGPNTGTCWLSFQVDFAFKSPLYRQVATMFFDEVVQHMMTAFESRCNTMYGPSALQKKGTRSCNLQPATV